MVLVIGIGWAVSTRWRSGSRAADVLTAAAARGSLVVTVADRGELDSSKSVEAMCEIEGGGKLVSIVPEGTKVKKGEEVARFDPDALQKGINEQEVKWEQADSKVKTARSELEVQKNKAEGEIAKAKLALTLAVIDHESYEEGEYLVELDKRKGTLELGKKELKEAEDGLEFTRSMVKKGFAQMEQKRVMELNVEGKRYAVRQQEADLKVLTKFSKVRKLTELKAKAEDAKRELERTHKSQAAATEKADSELRASLKMAEVEQRQLERVRRQLGKCAINAPEDGILIYYRRGYWDDGSRIRPGIPVSYLQPIITIPDLRRMKVNLKVHESVLKKVKVGQRATLKVDALPNQVLTGRVVSVGAQALQNDWGGGGVKEYMVEIAIDDIPADAELRPGMTAEATVLIKTVPDALTVPVQAVTESGGRHVCYVVAGGTIERREVRVGEANEYLVQILDGVSEGEQVALDARIRAGAELRAAGEEPAGPAKAATPPAEPTGDAVPGGGK